MVKFESKSIKKNDKIICYSKRYNQTIPQKNIKYLIYTRVSNK